MNPPENPFQLGLFNQYNSIIESGKYDKLSDRNQLHVTYSQ